MIELINPDGLPVPDSYTHVAVASGSRLVFVAGQVAEDADTIVGVQTLAEPGRLIEVEAIAVLD